MSEEISDTPVRTGDEKPTKITDNHTVFVGSKPFNRLSEILFLEE